VQRLTILAGDTLHNVKDTRANTTAKVLHWVRCWAWPGPLQSPDHTSPDFCLWEYLKEIVCSSNLRSLEELKHNSEQTVPKSHETH
jgi:hypothetical protein